jgi:hypothetical protein
MIDDEVEVVAEELAKIGGVAWYPGRQQGPSAVISTLDRIRTGRNRPVSQDLSGTGPQQVASGVPPGHLRPGATVIYRPPGDRWAHPFRIVEIRGDRAYLAPILRLCVGWVSVERLQPAADEGAHDSWPKAGE